MVQEFKQQEKERAREKRRQERERLRELERKEQERDRLIKEAQQMLKIRNEIQRQLELKEQIQKAKEDALREEIRKELERQREKETERLGSKLKLPRVTQLIGHEGLSDSAPKFNFANHQRANNLDLLHRPASEDTDLEKERMRIILQKFPEYIETLIVILQALSQAAQKNQLSSSLPTPLVEPLIEPPTTAKPGPSFVG